MSERVDRSDIAAKASKVILNAYFEDLQPTVRNLSRLKHPEKLASSSFVVYGLITHEEYADKLLNPDVLPISMGVRTPLLFALNLVSQRQLVTANLFRNSFLKNLSGANFVCPAIIKEILIVGLCPASTLHARYTESLYYFLFCPTALSA